MFCFLLVWLFFFQFRAISCKMTSTHLTGLATHWDQTQPLRRTEERRENNTDGNRRSVKLLRRDREEPEVIVDSFISFMSI